MTDRDDDRELAELARELPWDAPAASRIEAVRASLLAAATADEPVRARWRAVGAGFVAGAIAAAATLVVVLHDDRAPTRIVAIAPPPPPIATPTPPPAPAPVNPVHVSDGRIRVDGTVRVATGDAAIDAHGHCDVAASGDRLREVHVVDGDAIVRVRDQAAVFLAAGETWKPRVVAADLARKSAPPPPPTVSHDVETHFAAGWAALRGDRDDDAIRELTLAAAAPGNDALAADAQYFEAVALVHANRARDAEAALLAYLDRAPHASRRGRAIVMLARLLARRGDTAAASTWLDTVQNDPDPDVAAAARAGLR